MAPVSATRSGRLACVLRCGNHERMLTAGQADDDNRMELRAVIEGLRALNEPCRIEAITDAQYVQRGMLEHLPRWKTNGWQTANHEPWPTGSVGGAGFPGERSQDPVDVVRGHGRTRINMV